jgi:hypothetical protein
MLDVTGKVDRGHATAAELALKHVTIRQGSGKAVLRFSQPGVLLGIF